MQQNPNFKKIVYLILSIAYRRVNELNSSLKTLSKGISKYPKFTEAYIARGQLLLLLKRYLIFLNHRYDKALLDFNLVIKLCPSSGLGFLGYGDALKGKNQIHEALNAYKTAISLDPSTHKSGDKQFKMYYLAYLKRATLFYKLKKYNEALSDYEKLLEVEPDNSLYIFSKAKTLLKLGIIPDNFKKILPRLLFILNKL